MFTKDNLKEIEAAGFIGLPIEDVGARLSMLSKKFLKEYEIDEDAQLAYERGRSNKKVEILMTIDDQSDKEHKALDLASSIFGLKPTAANARKQAAQAEASKADDTNSSLMNPLMFMIDEEK